MKLKSRVIRSGFWQTKELALLSDGAQLMFIGLMGLADRDGLLEDIPEVITGQLRPFKLKNPTNKQLQELHDKGFIVRYEFKDRGYIYLPNLEKHQPIHKNEKSYGIPLPDGVLENRKVITGEKGKFPRDEDKGKDNSKGNGKDKEDEKLPEIPFEEIISHLNILAQKKRGFDWTTEYNQKQIKRRWKEGRRLEDFLYVNQVKSEEWLATDMENHLNPETLYGNKMEKYLNQRRRPRQYSEKTNKALIAAAKYLKNEGIEIEKTGPAPISSDAVETPVSIS